MIIDIKKDLCPDCGVSWEVLAEMLNEPDVKEGGAWLESENRTDARRLIESCEACFEHFAEDF